MDPNVPAEPADVPDPLLALGTELGALGRRLDRIGAELIALQASRAVAQQAADEPAPGPQPTPARPAPDPAAPPAPGAPWWAPGAPAGWASGPSAPPGAPWPAPAGLGPAFPQPGPAWSDPAPGPPAPPAGPATPAPSRRPALSTASLLAWTGGGVTLLGVVGLLVLAAARGYFTPEARVVAGAVLGVVLVGLGMRMHGRESARTGALALAATGFATLYLVVAGATFVTGLPTVPAVVLALVVAAAGLGLADRWRTQLLAGGVVVGAALLAPVLVEDQPLLVVLVLALQVAAVAPVLRRRWPVLALVAAAGPVLYGIAMAIAVTADRPVAVTLVASAVLLVGLATAALAAPRLPAAAVATLVAASPLPVIGAVPELSRWPGAALAAGAAAVLVATALLPAARGVVRQVALSAAAVALFQATAVAFDGSTRTAVLLGQATVLAILATVLRGRLPLVVSAAYGLVGLGFALVVDAPLPAVVDFPRAPYLVAGAADGRALVAGLVIGVLVLSLAVALLVACGRLGLARPDRGSAPLWGAIGLVGLYGEATVVITAALLVSPTQTGFFTGHALVTVSWTVAALVLLARGISRTALRVTGLVLVAAAVAKLFLFDSTELDGLARVAAFLGAGLVLLAAGTRYARLVAEAEAEAEAGGGDERGDDVPADPDQVAGQPTGARPPATP